MRSKGRWVAGVVAVVAGVALVRPLMGVALAGTPADGGGYAHAGVPSPSATSTKAPGSRAASVTSDYPVSGIDISSNDHSTSDITWPALVANGTRFVYVKATEGVTYTNPYFAGDYQAAKNNGMYAGAYAFGRPDQGNPKGQADYFIDASLWTGDSQTLIPFLDMEGPYPSLKISDSCWNLSPSDMTKWIRDFLTEVQARIGRAPMIYTGSYWWNRCTANDTSFGDYPLSIAAYTSGPPTLPAGWSTFALWQYAAGLNSQPGNYDKDVYNGDPAGLATLAGPRPPAVVSLLAEANGRFVTAESGGTKSLIANRSAIGSWEQFDEVPADNGYVGLRSHANGKYVTAEGGGAQPLIANRTVISTWEKFKVSQNADGSVSLFANANQRYVTAEGGGAQPLIANRAAIGPWERFYAIGQQRTVTLKAVVNGYVSADGGGAQPLIANRPAAGSWEQFTRIDLGNGYLALQAKVNGKWVTAESGGTKPLIANRTAIGPWEMFQLVTNADGTVSLLAHANGRYVTAESAGTKPLIANRTAIGSWESFDISS